MNLPTLAMAGWKESKTYETSKRSKRRIFLWSYTYCDLKWVSERLDWLVFHSPQSVCIALHLPGPGGYPHPHPIEKKNNPSVIYSWLDIKFPRMKIHWRESDEKKIWKKRNTSFYWGKCELRCQMYKYFLGLRRS